MFMKPSFVSRLFSHVSQQSHEARAWLKRYARNPRNVGSILPSSKMLGRAMTAAALRYGARDALFIEAGAGNGAGGEKPFGGVRIFAVVCAGIAAQAA